MSRDPARLPPLDLLAAFEAIARRGSVTLAAAERFVTQGAMSRQLKALEDDLGLPLFERRHRALALTPAGQRLLGVVTPLLAQLRETVVALRAPAAREVLSLTTTPGFASLWLIPRLAGFTGAHPGVDVRLDASNEHRDLVRDGFDLAVRYTDADSAAGQPLFGESIVPVCAPALLRRRATPLRVPADLARHTLLQMAAQEQRGGMPLEWESWLRNVGAAPVQPAAVLTFNSFNETMAAARAGHGVALGRRPLIDALLSAGDLVMPFGAARTSGRGYFVVVSPAGQRRAAVRALQAWLLRQAAAQA